VTTIGHNVNSRPTLSATSYVKPSAMDSGSTVSGRGGVIMVNAGSIATANMRRFYPANRGNRLVINPNRAFSCSIAGENPPCHACRTLVYMPS